MSYFLNIASLFEQSFLIFKKNISHLQNIYKNFTVCIDMDTSSSSDSEDSSARSDESSYEFSDSEELSDSDQDDELSLISSQMSLFDDDIVSDDDGCNPPCHWSTDQLEFEHIALDPFLSEGNIFGKPSQAFPDGTSPAGVVLSIVTDIFLALCVAATFEYGCTDPQFMKHLGDIFADPEKAKAFMLGFLQFDGI